MPSAPQLAVQLCAAGRPALYKLAASGEAAATSLIRLAIGQSGLRQVGEDAVLVRTDAGGGGGAVSFGVADGVGGWRDQGVDPGQASLALLGACSEAVAMETKGGGGGDSLKSALASAHRGLLASRRDLIGSTTVCLARLTPSARLLQVANLGDSGLCVLDAGFRLKMRTRFQSNMGGVFNCPMQLAFPSALSKQYPRPEDCELYSVAMEPGDIAVMATDGLWDNLYQQTIEEIFRHAFQKTPRQPPSTCEPQAAPAVETQLEAAAKILVDAATYLSAEQGYFSPFCQSAKDAGLKYSGGKEDDITVVLARLCPASEDSGLGPEPVAKL